MSATGMCKACGKEWSGYWRNQSTQDFIDCLAETLQICRESLVESREGRSGGTRIHRLVAWHLAQWLSPAFAVQVSLWIDELATKGHVSLQPAAQPDVSALLAEIANLRAEVAQLSQLRLGSREVGLPLGIRERIREVWPKAPEKHRARIVAQLKQLAFKRKIDVWQPVANGPLVIDQVHLPVVDEVIHRVREKAFNSYDMPLYKDQLDKE